MLATARPVLVRGLAKWSPLPVARPLSVVVRAYHGDAAAHKAKTDPPAAGEHDNSKQLTKQDADADIAAPRAMHPAVRLPSLFHEMQREMDAMSRMFGMSSMFDQDPFSSRAPAMLSKLELPSLPAMHVAVDVDEDDKAYTIKADVPGMPKDALKLSLHDNTLTISGERREERREEMQQEGEGDKEGGKAPVRYERSYGSFSRSFSLPPNVDVEGIKAQAQDGVLTVTIPKVPVSKPQPKEIEIK